MPLILPADVTLQESTLAFLRSGPKKLFIHGRWEEALSGKTFPTYNPATGEELAQVTLAGVEDVERAVQAARAAFEMGPWSEMSGEERGALLWKLADLIDLHADQLAELETLDNGKPLRVSRKGDLPAVSRHFRYYAGWAGKLEGSTIPVARSNQLVYTLREPVGAVGLIVPWNFPLLMCAWKLAPALACGNTAVLKPAEETPLTALRLGELIQQAGFPDGVVNIVTGPGEPTGAAITASLGIDKVSFTGSTEVGRKILEAAARSNLKRVSLELGGKSPNVIFADADLPAAIKGSLWAVFSTSGQECVAGSRLFVERPVYQQVLEGLAGEAQRIRVGNGFTPKVHIGPLISAEQLKRVTGYIQSGLQDGAELVAGGQRLDGDLANGYFLAPTVFAYQDDTLPLVQEEIFGPVAAVTPFDSWEELVKRANSTRYGLAAGLWTQNLSKAHRFARAVRAGTVWINGNYGANDPAAPFGGYKQSGFGREMGKEALELYTQVKTVFVGI
ncbi:MAG TPA: aldehyde dehydrogenase family protein [Anaerolineales bacterium]|nr:aldehyde dehydrogenase family protein [Anaerolineales bacterium]